MKNCSGIFFWSLFCMGEAVSAQNMDYSGVYTVDNNNICELSIEIIKNHDGYSYRYENMDGDLTINEVEGSTYLHFVGLKGDEGDDNLEAMFLNGAIVIQNYGNAMSEYTRFRKCDTKYLTLIKAQ